MEGGTWGGITLARVATNKKSYFSFGYEWVSRRGVEIGMVLREGWG